MKLELNNADEYLRPKQAASLLKVSPSTLAKWRHKGIGPVFSKLDSGTILYSRKGLIDFVNSCVELA